MASGVGLGPERAKAAERLMAACMAEPFYVAGTRRACTELMSIAPGRIFAKTGAEGVFCATFRRRATVSRSNARTAPPAAPRR
jgi:L-asparaginase II